MLLKSLATAVMLLSACAAYGYEQVPTLGSAIEVSLTGINSSDPPLYAAARERQEYQVYRGYAAASKKQEYGIRIKNNSSRRVGVVVAVDGLNVIDGKRSLLANSEKMYVLAPWSTQVIEGWRTSLQRVHRFYFTSEQASYAANFNDFAATGVIAVAAYPEYAPPLPETAGFTMTSANMARSAKMLDSAATAATGFGQGTESRAESVEFAPENRVSEKVLIRYLWRSTLCRQGLIDCRDRKRLWSDEGFAPYPVRFGHQEE